MSSEPCLRGKSPQYMSQDVSQNHQYVSQDVSSDFESGQDRGNSPVDVSQEGSPDSEVSENGGKQP